MNDEIERRFRSAEFWMTEAITEFRDGHLHASLKASREAHYQLGQVMEMLMKIGGKL